MLHIRLKFALILSVLAVLGGISPAQKPTTAHVLIKVSDPTGAPIPAASVQVFPVPLPQPSQMKTDQNGQLSLDLKLGGHALFVTGSGFKSEVRHIEVEQSTVEQVIPVKLQIGNSSGPLLVISRKEAAREAADRARKLFLSAMPYHKDWWITSDEFKAMPHTSVVVSDPATGRTESYSGVRLLDLLESAGVPIGTAWDDISFLAYLIAFGDSNSQGPALFSLAELQSGHHGDEVLVADSKNGQPLSHQLGPFMLVVSADEHHLRWIEKLNELTLHP